MGHLNGITKKPPVLCSHIRAIRPSGMTAVNGYYVSVLSRLTATWQHTQQQQKNVITRQTALNGIADRQRPPPLTVSHNTTQFCRKRPFGV